jgi:hypothetical protein
VAPQQPDDFGGDRAAFLPQWDFGKAGAFTGHLAGMRVVPDVEGLNGTRDVPMFRLITDDGEPFELWGSGMLSRVLPEHLGHRVRITDSGKTELDDNRQLHVYDVRCATCTAADRALVGGVDNG